MIVLTDDGKPKIIAQYDDGKLDGNLYVANAEGYLDTFAQYDKGKQHGFRCQFRFGQPAFVAQYFKDKLQALHQIDQETVAKSFTPAEVLDKNNVQATEAYGVLQASGTAFAAEERELRKELREVDLEDRQTRAAALSVEKRGREKARGEKRAAAQSSIINSLRRGTGF